MNTKTNKICALVASILLSWSCGTLVGNPEDDDDTTPPVVTIAGSPVKFFITDAPVDDAKSVLITVTSLSVSLAGEEWIDIPLTANAEIDLLQYQNGDTAELGAIATLAAGTYTQTRLILSEEVTPKLVLDVGTEHDLKIPSGTSSGIKIMSPFTVVENQPVELTIDFDLRKSLKKSNGNQGYKLSPVLRLAKNADTGRITGSGVSGTSACVYVARAPKDATDDCDNAVNSAKVKDGTFTLAFLSPGSYEVRVFDDSGAFNDLAAVNVVAGETVEATVD